MAQAFLYASKHGLVVAGLDIDDAVRCEARLGQRWSEQIRPRDDPKHLAAGSGSYSARKECGRRPVDRAVTAAGDFVERTECQAASR